MPFGGADFSPPPPACSTDGGGLEMDVIDLVVAVSVAEYFVALIRDGYHPQYKTGKVT